MFKFFLNSLLKFKNLFSKKETSEINQKNKNKKKNKDDDIYPLF